MFRGRGDSQSPWLYQYLLNASADEASECLEPTFVRVLKHVAGPFEDGSVRKQISDGDLFMDAVFSSKAIESGILCDDSEMEWDSCDLLLKRYRVRYEMPAINQNCVGQMILIVSECVIIASNRGLTFHENPSYCMMRPELRRRLQNYHQNLQLAEGSSCAAESGLAVSLLMAQMSEDVTALTQSQPAGGLLRVIPFHGPPELENFLISAEDQMRLDEIEEWLSDFVPAEETPPSTSHSDAAVQSHLSSQVHHPSLPSLPTNRPKMLCDASVQVTFCLHDTTTTRPATVDVGVEVGDSLMFNTQQPVVEPVSEDDFEGSYHLVAVPTSGNLPVEVPISVEIPFAVPTSGCVPITVPTSIDLPIAIHSYYSLSDVVPTPGNIQVAVPTSGYAPNLVPTSGCAPAVVPCSALLPPVLVPRIEDLPLREEMWSSGSSLRLSCDEEPNDLQRDPNLEMLGQRLASSNSSANMTVEDESPVGVHASKIPSPSPSLVAIIPGPSARKIHLEESTIDPVTSVLHCSEPERLDPVIATGMDFRFIQSTQIDYLSSQHCLVEPDFPLSPVMRSGEIQSSTQSFEPVRLETTSISGDKIVCGFENSPRAGNVLPQGASSGARGNVSTGESVPVSANVPKGGTISDDGSVPRGGNAPNVGSVPNFEAVVDSEDAASSGNDLRGGTVASGQSISCRTSIHSGGKSRIGGQTHPRSSDGNVCSSGVSSPRRRNVSNNELASSDEKIIHSSGSVDWSSLPDMISFGSADRAIEAEKCRNADGGTLLNTFERVSETEIREGNISVGRIVGRVWISPPRQPSQRTIDDASNNEEKLMNIRTASKGEDVRTKDATMNNVPVVGTEAARRELNMSPRHILTSDRCQTIPASLSVPLQLSVTVKTILAKVSVSNDITTATMSVATRDSSAYSKQTTPARVSVSNHFAPASLPVSHQICMANSTSCSIPQMSTASSDLRINPSTLTSLSQACANICLPVSVAGSTPSESILTDRLLPNNQPRSRTKSPSHSDIVARVISDEVPCTSELGRSGIGACVILKPVERESRESETDSFDEELIKSAESTKLRAELEPRESSSASMHSLDQVKGSTHALQGISVATHKETTIRNDDVTTKDKKRKIGEKKNKKWSSSHGKGIKDPMVLFAKRDSKKLTGNRKRKLFNVDQMLEGISSGNQSDSEDSDAQFDALGKRRATVDRAVGEKKFKGDSGGKSKKTDTRGQAGVAVGQSTDTGNLGNTNTVMNRTFILRTLPCKVAGEPNHLNKERTKESKIGSAEITNSAVSGKKLIKTVRLEQAHQDSSGLRSIDHLVLHSVKHRDVAAVGVNRVQIVPLESTVSRVEGDRESNRKTDGNCRFSEDRSWRVAADKLLAEKSRNRRSSDDMFTGLTDKPNDQDMPDDTIHHPQATCIVPEGAASRDKPDTHSCNKDITTFTDTNTFSKSRDPSARKYLHLKRSALKRTVAERDSTSRDRETVETSGSSTREGSSKSGESQMSVMERMSLPTPKNSLPSHQPPRPSSSIPHDDSGDQFTPLSSGQPSSPKLNRDRIKMLLGRDKMTAEAARAFSCSDLPENLKHWTFNYFKNWS